MLRTMHRPRIYLAGPMAGLTIEEATKWRNAFQVTMGRAFEFINPCRNKEDLIEFGPLGKDGHEDSFMGSDKVIFARDSHDVKTCDAVFAYFLNSPGVSVGTLMELGMAHAWGKPIISVVAKGSPYDHLFVRQASLYITDNPEEATLALRSIFNLL